MLQATEVAAVEQSLASMGSCYAQPTALTNFSARWIESFHELQTAIPEWDSLANHSIWRNPALEHNYLIPALTHLGTGRERVLVVEGRSKPRKGKPVLCGLLPIVSKRVYRLPIRAAEVWNHDQSFDSTPLIRAGYEDEVLQAIVEFLISNRVGLLSLDTVTAEPEFNSLVDRIVTQNNFGLFQRNRFDRAAYRPVCKPEDYFSKYATKNTRKNYRRLTKRLQQLGDVTFRASDNSSDYRELASQFLKIESSGWKRENGTALVCNPAEHAFYTELIQRSAECGKARFFWMELNGQPIAMLSDIRSGNKVYSYKTAFDNSFTEFSPGFQTEIKNLEFMYEDGIELADSCTEPDNSAINRIWGQRIGFQSLVLALKQGLPNIATQVMPWVQAAVRKTRRTKKTQNINR